MAYVIIFFGLLLTIAGVRNTHVSQGGEPGLFDLLQGDFTGQGSFVWWILAIAVIGGVGYVPQFKGLSRAFLVLVLIVLILAAYKKDESVFQNIIQQIRTGTTTAPSTDTQAPQQTGLDIQQGAQIFKQFSDYFGSESGVRAIA